MAVAHTQEVFLKGRCVDIPRYCRERFNYGRNFIFKPVLQYFLEVLRKFPGAKIIDSVHCFNRNRYKFNINCYYEVNLIAVSQEPVIGRIWEGYRTDTKHATKIITLPADPSANNFLHGVPNVLNTILSVSYP